MIKKQKQYQLHIIKAQVTGYNYCLQNDILRKRKYTMDFKANLCLLKGARSRFVHLEPKFFLSSSFEMCVNLLHHLPSLFLYAPFAATKG